MIISRKKYNSDLKEADQGGVTRGYKMGYLMGQIEKTNNNLLHPNCRCVLPTEQITTRLDRELEEIQHGKEQR